MLKKLLPLLLGLLIAYAAWLPAKKPLTRGRDPTPNRPTRPLKS